MADTPHQSFALVIPLANEAENLQKFVLSIASIFDQLGEGFAYLVVDKASRDNTLQECRHAQAQDHRFITVWAPENRNVVDAYLRGYREALEQGHPFIIEMDGGFSHDPAELPQFVAALRKGYQCVFGSRFMAGGNISDSNWKRTLLSRGGTFLSNFFLGTRLRDMTSGYQGFNASVVEQFLRFPLRSRAHFYQTELRYLARHTAHLEVPINYRSPSPSVSKSALYNAWACLFHYFGLRLRGKAPSLQ